MLANKPRLLNVHPVLLSTKYRSLFADIAPGQLNCIHLLAAISELCPDWLPKELFNVVLDRWRALGREPE